MTDEQSGIRQAGIRSRAVHLAKIVLASPQIEEPGKRYLTSALNTTSLLVAEGSDTGKGYSDVEHAPVFCALVRSLVQAVNVCRAMGLDSDTDEFVEVEAEEIEATLLDFE